MKIDSCEFPDDLYYDADGLVWARPEPDGTLTLGLTSIYAALTGRLSKVTAKPLHQAYEKGKALVLVESPRHFGPLRAPVPGFLEGLNDAAIRDPKRITDAPYGEGWLARLRPKEWSGASPELRTAVGAKDDLASQITALRVHCYAAFPDHEMFEIGTECSAVLARLDDLLARMALGEVVHLVSDDWTAPAEMENWSLRTRQPVIESRKEGSLYHFLVRKVA